MRRTGAFILILLTLSVCGWIWYAPRRVVQLPEVARVGLQRPRVDAPTENKLAFSTTDDDGVSKLWLWSAESSKLVQLAPEYSVFGFCFSPDGNRIAFLGFRLPPENEFSRFRKELWVLHLATEEVEQVTTDFWGAHACAIAWRPGTEQVAAARITNRSREALDAHIVPGDGGLWLIDVKTGEMTVLIGPSDSEYPMNSQPRFNGDGSMVASSRRGRYAAVLELDTPEEWFRLDRPKYMNPNWLMDWVWKGSSRTLLMAATRIPRRIPTDDAVTELKGPGGVWEWNTAQESAFISAGPHWWYEPDLLYREQTSAKPLFRQGESAYALALSDDETRVAYVTDLGLWVRDIQNHTGTQLVKSDELPGLSGLSAIDAEYGAGLSLASVSWSPDDRYLCLRWNPTGASHKLRVIDVTTKRAIPLSDRDVFNIHAAWRPAPKASR